MVIRFDQSLNIKFSFWSTIPSGTLAKMDQNQLERTLELESGRLSNDINKSNLSVADRVRKFVKKYFLEGQALEKSQEDALQNLDPNAPLHERILVKYRRFIAILIPFSFYHLIWWMLAFKHNYFANFPTHYVMSITMIVGSMVAGATSEGGGAVAFPVMTLALKIKPSIARDFSLMTQSCGMVTASFCILFMKIKVEWHSVIFCSLGAFFGLIFGLEVVDPVLAPPVKKLIFVSVWFSFCVALFLLNRQHKRKTFESVPNFGVWQGAVLVVTGFIGGIFTAIAGSGTDICSFSVLSLLFRISEKISTPTSVILMAINTVTGLFWRQFMTDTGAEPEAWVYLSVVVPIVVFFGPVGAFLSSHCHRQVLASFIYILDTIALVTALIVIPMTWQYWVLVVGLILGGGLLFFVLAKIGEKLVAKETARLERFSQCPLKGFNNDALELE